MIRICLLVSLALTWNIESVETLKCYSCRGGQDCGLRFSPQSTNVRTVESKKNETLSSCSISVTPEGSTTRELVPSYSCRSSSYQFCCNEDLCNSLISPPLPALTSLKCSIGRCTVSNGICITDSDDVTVLSSATESCSMTFGSRIEKSYKKGCQPTISDASRSRVQSLSKVPVFCCNSAECNRDVVTSGVPDPIIQCYTCDSRVTGPAGCSVFNESSAGVYKAGSSSRLESCATIVGLGGKDSVTGKSYPSFTIRTFVRGCVSKSLGSVSYGGASFRGRIDCCSKDFCNTKSLNETKVGFRLKRMAKIGGVLGLVGILSLVIGIIGTIVYRSGGEKERSEKSAYNRCATSEVGLPLKTMKNADCYPDPSASP